MLLYLWIVVVLMLVPIMSLGIIILIGHRKIKKILFYDIASNVAKARQKGDKSSTTFFEKSGAG